MRGVSLILHINGARADPRRPGNEENPLKSNNIRLSYVARALLAAFALLGGCSSEETPGTPMPDAETVTMPMTPTGPAVAKVRESSRYRSGGAVASLGGGVEYRFDFDADGAHMFTGYQAADSADTMWTVSGTYSVRSQARSVTTGAMSDWSAALSVSVGTIPRTEIIRIRNRWWVNSIEMARDVDFQDGVPDTLPYGSWITVYYQGVDSTFDTANCLDPVNKCWSYQMRHDWVSARDPNSFGQVPWAPPSGGVDTDPASVMDTMSMNVGTVDYTIFARVFDVFNVADPMPAQVEIVGNIPPTLDSFSIENYDGTTIADGDTIDWDWWAPADSGVVINTPNVWRSKTFYFIIRASGHDDPAEKDVAGGMSWRYRFEKAPNSGIFEGFGRANAWVDGVTTESIQDTHTFVALVPFGDEAGDCLFNNLPDWSNLSYDFTMVARDLPTVSVFSQYVIYDGNRVLTAAYNADKLAATDGGGFTFYLRLRR